MPAATAASLAINTRTLIGGRFKGFKPEEEKSADRAFARENKVTEKLLRLFEAVRQRPNRYYETAESVYQECVVAVKDIDYSADDVEEFSLMLCRFESNHEMGLFLSALINSGKDKDYRLFTKHLPFQVAHLGFMNSKDIEIDGDAGSNLGCSMKGGSIKVKGDVGVYAGHFMEDGVIEIGGSAGDWLGAYMNGGRIIVKKDAGHFTGERMYRGDIHVRGEIRGIGRMWSMFQDGRRISGRGEPVFEG